MKKFVIMMLAVVMMLGVIPVSAAVCYGDVPHSSWYYDAVDWSYHNGITSGYDDGNFYPTINCSRAQIVTMLYRYAQHKGYPTQIVDDVNFLFMDVDSDSYYYEAVKWAQWNDIVNGVSEQKFDPNGTCTRAQLVTMLYRLGSKFYGIDQTTLSGADCMFLDVNPSAYYFDSVCWAQWNEIIKGIGDQTFDPNGVCTRAQVVTMLERFDSCQ